MAIGKKTGGRQKGSLNKATKKQGASLSELARKHTKTALDALVQIVKSSESDAARVSAATAILDRGYGKPAQAVMAKVSGTLTLAELVTGSILPGVDNGEEPADGI